MTQENEEPLPVYLLRRLRNLIVFGGVIGLSKIAKKMDPASLVMLILLGVAIVGTIQLFLHFLETRPVPPPPPLPPRNESPPPIRFTCPCGTRIKVPATYVGQEGRCGQCGRGLTVPARSDQPVRVPVPTPSQEPAAVPVAASSMFSEPRSSPRLRQSSASQIPRRQHTSDPLCSICQTVIFKEESVTDCDVCGLPFHSECWNENQGCSAYGCANVHVLKSTPVMRMEFPTSPPPLPNRTIGGGSSVSPDPNLEMFRAFLLLGGTALAGFFSLILFGIPSLITGVIALIAWTLQIRNLSPQVLKIMLVLSLFGFLGGSLISSLVWRP